MIIIPIIIISILLFCCFSPTNLSYKCDSQESEGNFVEWRKKFSLVLRMSVWLAIKTSWSYIAPKMIPGFIWLIKDFNSWEWPLWTSYSYWCSALGCQSGSNRETGKVLKKQRAPLVAFCHHWFKGARC